VQLASGRVVPVTAVYAGDTLLGEGGRPARVVFGRSCLTCRHGKSIAFDSVYS